MWHREVDYVNVERLKLKQKVNNGYFLRDDMLTYFTIVSRSDLLQVGDILVSVNGIKTSAMRHEEIINLMKNATENVRLEIEYELPDLGMYPDSSTDNCLFLLLNRTDSVFFQSVVKTGR